MLPSIDEKALGGTNLEFKAPLAALERGRERLRELGAELQGVERQEDRYFAVASARMKLRVSSRDGAHLVIYSRPASGRFRTSRFHRLPVDDPEGLAAALEAVLGAGPRVTKTREVWWWRDVRVHLDEVEGLGTYVELEARMDRIGDPAEAAERMERLCAVLEPGEAIMGSYGDMAWHPAT